MIFREATSEERQIILNMKIYSFSGDKNKYGEPKDPPTKYNWYQFKDYVVEDSGTIIAVIAVIDFSQLIRGSYIKMAGMGAVACRPGYRRQGYVTKLFEFVFKKISEEGFLASTLYPFDYKFYEQLGYGQADSLHVYTTECSNIIHHPTPNRIIIEDYDVDYKRSQPIYNLLSMRMDGLVKREPSTWKFLLGWNWRSGGFQFICQDLDGNDVGYLILRFEKKDDIIPDPYILVREMVFFDSETKQALLNFLANHDSQRKYVRFAPFDRNYLPYFKSPKIHENKEIPNSMFRIIDVEQLLPLLKYPSDIETKITLDIVDMEQQCPWNTKKLTLEIKEGQGTIISEVSSNFLRLGIKAFSQIIIGFYDPFELAEVGEVEGSSKSLKILSEIFPKQISTLRDFF